VDEAATSKLFPQAVEAAHGKILATEAKVGTPAAAKR